MEHFLGALKPKVDKRDYRIAAGASELPDFYMCEDLPPVKNQRSVSSCVAHATSSILEFFNKKETGKFIPLSTNFIYGMQGVAFGRLEGGMYLRDACKIVKEYGDATEKSVNGNTEQPKCTEWLKEKLTDEIYDEAKNFRVESYAKCTTAKDIKAKAIIAVTKSGTTARRVSKFRPAEPIVAATPDLKTFHQLALSWGVSPVLAISQDDTERLFRHAIDCAKQLDLVTDGDKVVITAGVPLKLSGTTNILKVQTV